MESSRLSARLAAYLDAIQAARKAGVTWTQLGHAFGTSGKYMAEAAKVAASGKYLAHEQLPLPSPSIQATGARNVGQDNSRPQDANPVTKPPASRIEGAAVDWEALARKNKAEAADIQWKG